MRPGNISNLLIHNLKVICPSEKLSFGRTAHWFRWNFRHNALVISHDIASFRCQTPLKGEMLISKTLKLKCIFLSIQIALILMRRKLDLIPNLYYYLSLWQSNVSIDHVTGCQRGQLIEKTILTDWPRILVVWSNRPR